MSASALSPVAAGVYAALAPALVSLATGGVFDGVVPQGTQFPFVWFSVSEENARGMGRVGPRLVRLRVSAMSEYGGDKELEQILSAAVALLEDATLTVAGYRPCGEVFYDNTVDPIDEVFGGVRCREAAANFRLYVE